MTREPPQLSPDDIGARCVVTGSAGYLGRALVARLSGIGCEVVPIDRASDDIVDIRDFDTLAERFAGADVVIHAAALISTVDERAAQPRLRRAAYAVNVVGTDNVIRACRAAGVGALVHTSSFNVVMDHPIDGGDEALPYASRSGDLYTRTKVAAERAVRTADGKDGLRTCALRPGGIWGPGEGSLLIDGFLDELARGAFKATIGDGATPLDNTHVENAVDAHLLAAQALRARPDEVGGKAYFITDGERIDAMEWFRPIVEGLDHAFPRIRVPGAVMLRVAAALELAHRLGAEPPKITRRSIRNLTEGGHFSIDAAARDLGYTPRFGQRDLAGLLGALRERQAKIRAAS